MSDATVLPEEIRDLLFSAAGAPLLADVVSWAKWRNAPCETAEEQWAYIQAVFRYYPEFRSLLDYRLRQTEAFRSAKLLTTWRRATDLHIHCERIGGGFRIQHGHSTWVVAEEIGENFQVNQNVTIGVGRGGKPTIGNNVYVFTGAVVTGKIRIGDHVTIAPNAFVNFDVEDNMDVFPAPALVKPKKPFSQGGGRPPG